jgi:hypothetical protein
LTRHPGGGEAVALSRAVLVSGVTGTIRDPSPSDPLVVPPRGRADRAGRGFLPQAPSGRAIRCAVHRLLSLRRCPLRIHATEPLFAWGALEDCPTLVTLRDFLQAVPDQALLDGLIAARGHGRDDYPIPRLWHVVLLTIALRHTSFNACLTERHRNPALGRLLGIPDEGEIPRPHNLSRFLDALGGEPHVAALRHVFDTLARRLGLAVPDLGRHTAGDATALSGRAKADPEAVKAEVAQGRPQPSGGKKEHTDAGGRVTQVYEWFGYKLHLLVDVKHEVALAYHVTDTKAGDNERVPALVGQAMTNLPKERIRALAYDKAADDGAVHECLRGHGIKPLIQNRALWQGEPERPLPGGRYPLHLVHD